MTLLTDANVLRMAADSPDPKVRAAAMRWQTIQEELRPIDAFLSFYGGEAAALVVPPAEKKTTAQPVAGKTLRLVEKAAAILTRYGRPMTSADLFEVVKRENPELCPKNSDSMRARLNEHKDAVTRVDGRGYWPTGMEVPEADG